jgi:hypothetical protein
MKKVKCKECGEWRDATPVVLDALGRKVRVTDIILWMRPILNYRDGDVYISTKKVIGYEPVVVIPKVIETCTLDWTYCIDGMPYHFPDRPIDIRGKGGEKNPLIYKIADCISEL